jgi:hypothetical protein
MYIRDIPADVRLANDRLERDEAARRRVWTRTSTGIGQATLQQFGPAAVQSGQPFELTSEQIKTILQSLRHAPGAETFFYIHSDVSGRDATFKFGEARAAAAGVLHQSDFQWGAALDEAAKLSRKDRPPAGSAAVKYQPAGFGHSHPRADAGKPSGTDLGQIARIPTPTPMVALVFATAKMPRPSAVTRSATRPTNASVKRMELEASVVWRSAYGRASNGTLLQPRLALPGTANYASHQEAAAAMRRISPDLTFKYFAGKIVHDNGQFSSEFVEVR